MNLARPKSDLVLDALRSREWLETNGVGGWASSTLAGINTRRYHGLLVAATKPPTGRMVLLSKLEETISEGDSSVSLSANDYPGAVHPRGFELLQSCTHLPFPVFVYEAFGHQIRKTICAVHGENTTIIVYEVLSGSASGPLTLELRPLVAGRDYHSLTHANSSINPDPKWDSPRGVLQYSIYSGLPDLFIAINGAEFHRDPAWYYRFHYAVEAERGLDCEEDLFCPGVFRMVLTPGSPIAVVASTERPAGRDPFALLESERNRRAMLCGVSSGAPAWIDELHLAADKFVVARGKGLQTVIAGYPWFTDWGRDTMIALPGLCLATGKLQEARGIFRAFAANVSEGMIPNRFPDDGGGAEYNTVDATLWFFVALWKYFERSEDLNFIREEMYPVLKEICAWHFRGTRYDIRSDTDGLLFCGMPGVQLTWMDAKIGDWVVTPRMGKPVEISALWYNALMVMGEFAARIGKQNEAQTYRDRARHTKNRFEPAFWNHDRGCLFDVIDGEVVDPAIRPNQLFALSLPFPLLSDDGARSVLEVVERELLTPVGLRSLARGEPGYSARYEGNAAQRDAAYHQGTVWSYLIGPYITALVRYRGEAGRVEGMHILDGLVEHLSEAGLGMISEIFDAEAPHTPRGCFAQAWSVGEVLRTYYEDLSGEQPTFDG